MSRSHAMRRIWRTLKRQVAETQPGRALFTRREMLKASGLALGGLILSGRSAAQAWRGATAPRIGIVGAGIAGVTAALTLQENGLPCSIYESSGRIGGRMHSNNTFWQEGQTSEWCGEFIDSDHVVIRRLAQRFGLTLSDVVAAEPPNSQDTNYFLGGYYTDEELAADMAQILPTLYEQNQQIGAVVVYDQYNAAGYYFDHLNAYDWIETYVPGGHSSRLGQYLDVATVTEFGLNTSQQSSLNLIFPLNSDERYHIKNGNQQLPTLIAQSLPVGTIRRGWRMTEIVANSDETVTLTFDTSSGLQTATFDYVILALPFSVLCGLDYSQANFDALKQTAITQLGYGTNSKLILQFNDRYWNGRGAWPGIGDGFIQTDLPFQSAWDSSRAEPGADGLLTDYTGGANGAAYQPNAPYTTSRSSAITAGYATGFLEQLEIVWPGITAHYNGLATLSYPTGDPNLLGSYSCYKVGQYTQFAGYERAPQGRIHFAGEHTSYIFQGYMEGGAETGERAAKEIIGDIDSGLQA
jgi:monoamine oxidase